MTGKLTHFDDDGRPRMVDVSGKPANLRTAVARGFVKFSSSAYAEIRKGTVGKGDICRVAELAGIMGAKRTPDLIPLCHPLAISGINVSVEFSDRDNSLLVTARVKTAAQTGVEMEALTAVSVACLTIYDMAKAIEKSMTIGPITLLEKTGGKSGDFSREK